MTPVGIKTLLQALLSDLNDAQKKLDLLQPDLKDYEQVDLTYAKSALANASANLTRLDAGLFEARGLPPPHAFKVGDKVRTTGYDPTSGLIVRKLSWGNGGPWYYADDGKGNTASVPEDMLELDS